MALISSGMATVVAAASLGIILLGPGSRNVVSDRLVFKDIYNNIQHNVVCLGNICPICGAPMVVRRSRFGKLFYGCSKYPKCTGLVNI